MPLNFQPNLKLEFEVELNLVLKHQLQLELELELELERLEAVEIGNLLHYLYANLVLIYGIDSNEQNENDFFDRRIEIKMRF